MLRILAIAVFLVTWLTACQPSVNNTPEPTPSGHAEHVHHAPHGGTLIELGEEEGHLELLLDKGEGVLTVYVLDGEAEKSVRISAPQVDFRLSERPLKLQAVESPLTGETVGDTSQFELKDDSLKGLEQFEAQIPSIEIKGQTFKDIKISYPDGNEHDEHDGSEHK